jgi:two-component system phosphate regulon response regulator PhoB
MQSLAYHGDNTHPDLPNVSHMHARRPAEKTILIVDNQPGARELVSVTLEEGPYRIYTASNGSEALDLAYRHKPDLILMDVVFPNGPDGLEVTHRLKSDKTMQGTYIVLLTAHVQQRDREAGYAAGADDYIAKPFSPSGLFHRVRQILGA